MVRTEPEDEHESALYREVHGEGGKGAADEVQGPPLPQLRDGGQLPEHDRRGADLDKAVETEARQSDRSRQTPPRRPGR